MGKLNTYKQIKFHIFCCSSVILTDIGYYDNSSHWASYKLGNTTLNPHRSATAPFGWISDLNDARAIP